MSGACRRGAHCDAHRQEHFDNSLDNGLVPFLSFCVLGQPWTSARWHQCSTAGRVVRVVEPSSAHSYSGSYVRVMGSII
jgi:hypothetical protein